MCRAELCTLLYSNVILKQTAQIIGKNRKGLKCNLVITRYYGAETPIKRLVTINATAFCPWFCDAASRLNLGQFLTSGLQIYRGTPEVNVPPNKNSRYSLELSLIPNHLPYVLPRGYCKLLCKIEIDQNSGEGPTKVDRFMVQ